MTNEPVFQPPVAASDAAPLPGSPVAVAPAEQLDQSVAGGTAASTDVDEFNADEYEYVRIGGKVHAIPKSSIQDEPETAKQSIPKTEVKPVEDPHYYVWLANGQVIRVKESDLPTPAGTNAAFGHWQIDDKVYVIVNVVPVETIVKGGDK